jgi:hypothetical protein
VSFHSIRARAARAGLHAPVARLRHFGLDSTDVLLASHGRSGNTLLRFILGEILSGVPSTFDTIQRIIPEMGLQLHAYPIIPGGGRLIKTHEPYCRAYKRAIYIIRDVRDVILSHFARETAVGSIHPSCTRLDDYVRPFLQGKISHWGSWQAHVDSWVNSPLAKSGDLLLLRFEDMREDLEGSVVRCLEFLGKHAEPSLIHTAIRNNSVEKMRAKERESKRMMKVAGDGRQVNHGVIERWRTEMTEQQLRIVDEYAGDTLARFGYPSGVSSRSDEQKRAEAVGPRRWDFSNIRIPPVKSISTGSTPQLPRVKLEDKTHPSASRALRIRVGGRIANLFSWYRY